MISAPNREALVTSYGHLFEHSPWVVERAWERQPFAGEAAFHAALMAVVEDAGADLQLGLIRAHPRLGARIALTADSEAEQAGAGLKNLTPREFAIFTRLNQEYEDKFGFPFVICVRRQTKAAILGHFARRLAHDAGAERAQALREIGDIARLRLADMQMEPTA